MHPIQAESISDFRENHQSILKKVADGPVLLLHESSVAAVLVSPERWNRIAWNDLNCLPKPKQRRLVFNAARNPQFLTTS